MFKEKLIEGNKLNMPMAFMAYKNFKDAGVALMYTKFTMMVAASLIIILSSVAEAYMRLAVRPYPATLMAVIMFLLVAGGDYDVDAKHCMLYIAVTLSEYVITSVLCAWMLPVLVTASAVYALYMERYQSLDCSNVNAEIKSEHDLTRDILKYCSGVKWLDMDKIIEAAGEFDFKDADKSTEKARGAVILSQMLKYYTMLNLVRTVNTKDSLTVMHIKCGSEWIYVDYAALIIYDAVCYTACDTDKLLEALGTDDERTLAIEGELYRRVLNEIKNIKASEVILGDVSCAVHERLPFLNYNDMPKIEYLWDAYKKYSVKHSSVEDVCISVRLDKARNRMQKFDGIDILNCTGMKKKKVKQIMKYIKAKRKLERAEKGEERIKEGWGILYSILPYGSFKSEQKEDSSQE